jgi:iron-sulfur cluster repair protein YtfE (RIC family)
MADALAAAHEHQIIHRDLKPDNVYLTVRNRRMHFVKLMDFGIAKMTRNRGRTQAGTIMGTALYMSPEQALGSDDVGPASDIYSLGVIMYHLATGVLPFDGTCTAVMAAHVGTPPKPPRQLVPEVPAVLEEIILTCLAKQPHERFGSMRELSAALQKAMAELGVSADLPRAQAATLAPTMAGTVMLRGASTSQAAKEALSAPPAVITNAPSKPAASASSMSGASMTSATGSKGLTAQLREAHVQVVEQLTALRGRGGVNDQVRAELLNAQAIFTAHIQLEDERLYPVLHKHAKQDPRLSTILALLGRDAGETSSYAKGFFERCLALGPNDGDALDAELDTAFPILMARQWKEDNSLFAEYDKIKGHVDPVTLIVELRANHADMVQVLEEARACGDPQQTRALLFKARDALTAHMELEDDEFYPVLRKHAATDAKLRSTLDILAKDMTEISAFAAAFFHLCANEELDDEDLTLECEQLVTILMARLWKEENILFPRYIKLTSKKRAVVDELLLEHERLRDALDAIKTFDLGTLQGRDGVFKTKQALLDHMQREEETMGVVLKKAAESDEGLRQTLSMFETDLEDLYDELMGLFDRVAGGNTTEFAEAYGGVLALMKARMKREETILFPHFSKLVTAPSLAVGA